MLKLGSCFIFQNENFSRILFLAEILAVKMEFTVQIESSTEINLIKLRENPKNSHNWRSFHRNFTLLKEITWKNSLKSVHFNQQRTEKRICMCECMNFSNIIQPSYQHLYFQIYKILFGSKLILNFWLKPIDFIFIFIFQKITNKCNFFVVANKRAMKKLNAKIVVYINILVNWWSTIRVIFLLFLNLCQVKMYSIKIKHGMQTIGFFVSKV